jgi:hypothetical protein
VKTSHNKKRNSALLYEFLIRHISRCLVDENKSEAQKAMAVAKKYFGKGTLLNEELSLYRAISDTTVSSTNSANKIVSYVVNRASRQNARMLDAEKSRLIREVNYNFNKAGDFYKAKVPDYMVHASTYALLSDARKKQKTLNEVSRIKLQDVIVEHLKKEKGGEPEKIKTNPKFSKTVQRLIVKKFHEKYDDKLTEGQKGFLKKYMVCSLKGDEQGFRKVIDEQVELSKKKLRAIRDPEVKSDKELSRKIRECYKKLACTDFSNITEDTIVEVMQYLRLAEEVES